MIAPSGEQITTVAGDQQAVVVEVGGGLRSYSVGGRDLVDGYSADEMSSSGRGQVLIPWPNRLQDGTYDFDGQRHQLPLNEPERHNAIHGLVRWAPWTIVEREPDRVTMEHVLYPQPGYPFSLRIRMSPNARWLVPPMRNAGRSFRPLSCSKWASWQTVCASRSCRTTLRQPSRRINIRVR